MQANELALLAKGIFSSLNADELSALADCMKVLKYPAGEMVNFQRGFNVLIEGNVSVLRENLEIGELQPGDGFGDWGLWGWMQARVTLRADSEITVGQLDEADLEKAIAKYPSAILRVIKSFSRLMDAHLENLSQLLLDAYSAPSPYGKRSLNIVVDGEEKHVRIGTSLSQLLPSEIDGKPVVSGIFNHKQISLNRPLYTNGIAEALTLDNLEGRNI